MKPSDREKLETLCQKPENRKVSKLAKKLWSNQGLSAYHALNKAKKQSL